MSDKLRGGTTIGGFLAWHSGNLKIFVNDNTITFPDGTSFTPSAQSWASIINKPTTLLGYGITDAVPALVTSTTSTGTTNAATSNTNTFLNVTQSGASPGSSTQITGAGSVTVASTSTGKLTISGTNNTYTGSLGVVLSGSDFRPNYGSTANTITQGNDSRLSDARTPLAHTHTFASLTSKPTTLAGYGIAESEITTLAGNSYSVGTKAILDTGTSTTSSVYSPLTLNQWLNGKNFASSYYGYSLGDMYSGFVPTNLNTIMNTSILGFNAPSNSPYAYGSVWTHRRDSGECNQIAIDTLSDNMSFRRQQSGTFNPWRTIYHSGNYNAIQIEEVTNFNNVEGFKILKGSTSSAQNTPLGSWTTGIQFEPAENSQYFSQLVFDIQGRLFTRTKSANVIGSYKEVATIETDSGYTTLTTPGLNGITPFTTKTLRFKIHNGFYIIDGEFTCNGTGPLGTLPNTTISDALPRIDPETIETISLDAYVGMESGCFSTIKLEKSGIQVFLKANLRSNTAGTTKFRATLPIASVL